MKFIANIHLRTFLLFIWFYKIANLETKNFPDNSTWINTIYNKSDIRVNIPATNYSNFLKIMIKGQNETLIHYVLSFYQNDSSFTERYQLFQSYNKEIEMWLKKDQFNEIFYFSIECDEYPCKYKCIITEEEEDHIELNFNKIYNYYVTKETESMEFSFKRNDIPYSKGDKLLIWAKGNKNLTVINEKKNSMEIILDIINGNMCTYEKDINTLDFTTDNIKENIKKKYHFYLLELSDDKESQTFNETFKLDGELGDIINAGSIIFNENGTSKFILEDNIEISGLLKNVGMKTICFEHGGGKSLTFINHDYVKFTKTEKDKMFCLTLKNGEKDGFFSFYYINNNNKTKNDLNYPKVIGIEQPMRYIKEKNSIQLVISKPSDYFDYFIYSFNTPNDISIEGYFCDSYPFCDVSDSDSMTKINLYESFKDITFLKNHFNNHSLSLIGKNQLILIINCINSYVKVEDEIEDNKDYFISEYCLTDIYIYKEIYHSEYVYRNKTTEDHYTFNYDYSFSYSLLNIELFYGEIYIQINESLNEQFVSYYNKNRYLYEIHNSVCELTITTNVNTSYHISYAPLIMTIKNGVTYFTHLYNIEGTYLIHFDEYYNSFSDIFFENNFANLSEPLLALSEASNENLLLINFSPINCQIEFGTNITNISDYSYQSLIRLSYNSYPQSFHYSVKKKNKEDCMFLVSVYNLNFSNTGIVLTRGVPRIFNFPSNSLSMDFSYYHQRHNFKNIIISLDPYNANFDVVFLFNNASSNSTNFDKKGEDNVHSRTEIKVITDNIVNDLEDKNCYERYLIKFRVTPKNDGVSNLKINIVSGNDALKNFMIIYNIIILVIIIIVASIFVFIHFRKRKPKFKKEESYLIELGEGEEKGKKNEAILDNMSMSSEL